jgi:thiol-disulfide isomerase/thioredoxin
MLIRSFLFFTFLSQPAFASSEPAAPAHGEEKKEESKPVEKAASRWYVHKWSKFPDVLGIDLLSDQPSVYAPKYGKAIVAIFTASWCEKCQQMMPRLKTMQSRLDSKIIDIKYIFVHDTKEDAKGFATEYKIIGDSILGQHDVLKNFKNPELPAVFVGDRYEWLAKRYTKIDTKQIEDVESFLNLITAF